MAQTGRLLLAEHIQVSSLTARQLTLNFKPLAQSLILILKQAAIIWTFLMFMWTDRFRIRQVDLLYYKTQERYK